MKANVVIALFVVAFFFSFKDVYSQSAQPQAQASASDGGSIHRDAQISFLPGISTDGFSSDKVTCDFSLNILAGRIYQVNSVELGSILNVDRSDAGKCQLSGIGNLVGGSSKGFQAAGVFNYVEKTADVQMAGIINRVGRGAKVQMAGVVNLASDSAITQLAGIANHASAGNGCQIAGVVNHLKGEANVQIAGIVNLAKTVKGCQIAGVVNYASKTKGSQIGFINISDTCEGIPFGVINWVKNGYHKIEVSGDDLFYSNLALRSGVKKFHTMIIAGICPADFDRPLWNYGWGMGSSFSLNEKTLLDIDLSEQQIMKGSDFCYNNRLYKISVGVDRKIASKASVFVALTYNFLTTDTNDGLYEDTYSSIAPYSFTNHTYHRYNLKTWAGLKVGLRFF